MKSRFRMRLMTLTIAVVLLPLTAFPQSIVGVLGIPTEIAPIEKRLQNSVEQIIRGHVFHLGTLGGQRVVVGRSGIGKVNAAIVATLLIDHFNPVAILFSGTAGGLDSALHPGDIVIGVSVAQHDVGMQTPDGLRRRGLRNTVTGVLDPLLLPAPETLLAAARRSVPQLTLPPIKTTSGTRVPRIIEGIIVTGDVFLADAVRGDELRKSLGASAVEMEGGAVVQTCRQFTVSCLVVRSITDRADGQATESYKEFITTASENAAALVTAIIAQLGGGVR